MNNPLKYIDPTGMDTINVNTIDKTMTRLSGGNDVFIIIDQDGNTHSLDLGQGVFGDTEYGMTDGEDIYGNPITTPYIIINMNNSENATKLFEFAANNSLIEWGRGQMKHYQNGNEINTVSTSYQGDSEKAGNLVEKKYRNDYYSLVDVHSHPLLPGYTLQDIEVSSGAD